MNHSTRREDNITILDLSGEVEVSQAPKLRDVLINLLEQNSGRLLVNMTDVVYIDSAGLSVLIAANRQAQKIGGGFGISNPQPTVQQVFRLTRMNQVFQIYDTVTEGITALAAE